MSKTPKHGRRILGLTRQRSLFKNPRNRGGLRNDKMSLLSLCHSLWASLNFCCVNLKGKIISQISARLNKKYRDGDTFSCVGKVKSLFLWTPLKTCYHLNAVCGLEIPDSNKISEAPRNAIYLYWQDKESSRRDQRWQPILTKFTILFQVSVLKRQDFTVGC